MLKTERICLDHFRPGDEKTIFSYRNHPECARYQRWEDVSEAAVAAFVKKFESCVWLSSEEEQHYAIRVGETLVGDLSYFYNEEDRCVTLGITIAPEHQRKGYARELLPKVADAVRNACPALDIVALIDPENKASIALFEGLGFLRECYAEKIKSYVYVIYGSQGL